MVANAVNEQIILGKILDNFNGYTRVEDVVADAIKIYQELLYEGKDWVTWLTVSERMKGLMMKQELVDMLLAAAGGSFSLIATLLWTLLMLSWANG